MRRAILSFAVIAHAGFAALLLSGLPVHAVALLFVSHMLILYPTLRATSQWLGPVVTSFRPAGREVWLTIDDGPDPQDTRPILDLLERHRARATFFVKGERLAADPALGGEIVRRGHTLGNHSHTHPSGTFWALGPSRLRREVDRCNEVIASVAGAAPMLFRAPVGMKNPFLHPILAERAMKLVAWSSRGFDAVAADAGDIVERIASTVRPGTIILLHEGHAARDGSRVNQKVLELLLERLTADGYSFVIPAEPAFVCGRA